MKEIKIKCPKRFQDCNIEQVGRWIEILDNLKIKDPTELLNNASLMVDVISIFSGVRVSVVRKLFPKDLRKIYLNLLEMLSQHEITEPKGEVTINGVKYVMNKDFKKITTGQVIDIKMIEEPYKQPSKLMAILYNEQGFVYGQEDENFNHLKPTKDRQRIFSTYFPVGEFINCMGFFLNSYERRSEAMALIQIVKTEKAIEKTLKELKTEIQENRPRRSGFSGRNKLK